MKKLTILERIVIVIVMIGSGLLFLAQVFWIPILLFELKCLFF
jgi:hypothetical protein